MLKGIDKDYLSNDETKNDYYERQFLHNRALLLAVHIDQ